MTNLDSIFKSRDITLPTKVRLVKAMVFPVVMYGCPPSFSTLAPPFSPCPPLPRPAPLFLLSSLLYPYLSCSTLLRTSPSFRFCSSPRPFLRHSTPLVPPLSSGLAAYLRLALTLWFLLGLP